MINPDHGRGRGDKVIPPRLGAQARPRERRAGRFANRKAQSSGQPAEARTLTEELQNFQVKISLDTAHDSYGAGREGAHDDLVLAVCLALWIGENVRLPIEPPPLPGIVGGNIFHGTS